MTARTEVPEWCRTDVESAIGDAVMRWVRAYVGGRTRAAMSHDLDTVARDVITALQGVGVPFSGATGAGAEHERANERRDLSEALAWFRSGDASLDDLEYGGAGSTTLRHAATIVRCVLTRDDGGVSALLRRCEEIDRTTWRADGDPAGGGQISTAEVWRMLAGPALQGVSVPFSGATEAGAEYEATPPRRVMVPDPVRGEQLATAANGDAATTWRCEGCGATVHYWPFDGIPGAVCEYVRGETADYAWVAHAPRCTTRATEGGSS